MSDEKKLNGAANGAQQSTENAPMFRMVRQFARDISFECPDPAKLPDEPGQRQFELEVGIKAGAHPANENWHEVGVLLRSSAKNQKGDVAYMAEVEFVGIYEAKNIPADRLSVLLGIEAPALLFPFGRSILMGLIQNAGFVAPMVEPVNFAALYMQAQQQQQQQAANA